MIQSFTSKQTIIALLFIKTVTHPSSRSVGVSAEIKFITFKNAEPNAPTAIVSDRVSNVFHWSVSTYSSKRKETQQPTPRTYLHPNGLEHR
jgi:hypothetical protein